MIRLMVADSCKDLREQLCKYLNKQPGIQVIASAGDGGELERLLNECMPDVLLMELALPVIDGLEVMRNLKRNPRAGRLKVIVLSCMMLDRLIQQSMQLGAAYYMIKPYDRELLYRRISEICSNEQPLAEQEDSAIQRAGRLLRQQGISSTSKGNRYMRAAIESALDSPDGALLVTKKIYPEVARQFDTQPRSVERAIRSSIESAWARGAMQRGGWFDGNRRPSNSEFLARLLEEL